MKTLAYINGDMTTEKFQELEQHQVTQILIDVALRNGKRRKSSESLNQILETMSEDDCLIISDLANLNKTVAELATFFKKIQQKKVKLIILNKDKVFSVMTDYEFLNFVMDLHQENQFVAKDKTKKSQKHSKNVGRPKLSQEKIERIRWLRVKKNYSLKEVAKLCDVSVGTAFKYSDREEQDDWRGVEST